MAFRWRADDGPTLNALLVAAIFRGSGPVSLENPNFVIFQGGGGGGGPDPVPHSESAYGYSHSTEYNSLACYIQYSNLSL